MRCKHNKMNVSRTVRRGRGWVRVKDQHLLFFNENKKLILFKGDKSIWGGG